MDNQAEVMSSECRMEGPLGCVGRGAGGLGPKKDFDITLQCNFKRNMMESFGFPPEYYEREETLYFDEAGNQHSVNTKGGRLNIMTSPEEIFVLGGVQSEEKISVADFLREILYTGKHELKSVKYFDGDYGNVLRKEHAKRFLEYVIKHNLHAHYMMVQLLYFGFVDIVDSVSGDMERSLPRKEMLSLVLSENLLDTVKLFVRYTYPDVPKKKGREFLREIIRKVEHYECSHGVSSMTVELKGVLTEGLPLDELVFINDENRDMWVGEFWTFYLDRLGAFSEKHLIFDNENSVKKHLDQYRIINKGKEIDFSFCDSKTESMVLVSDLTVGLLRKFFIFHSKGCPGMSTWSSDQRANHLLFMRWLALSHRYNPTFAEYVCSISLRNQIEQMIGC